jgi:hypothetical protein
MSWPGTIPYCGLTFRGAIKVLFELLMTEIGGATDNVSPVIEDILHNASEITELRVD